MEKEREKERRPPTKRIRIDAFFIRSTVDARKCDSTVTLPTGGLQLWTDDWAGNTNSVIPGRGPVGPGRAGLSYVQCMIITQVECR